jgi:hypothetical protein
MAAALRCGLRALLIRLAAAAELPSLQKAALQCCLPWRQLQAGRIQQQQQ